MQLAREESSIWGRAYRRKAERLKATVQQRLAAGQGAFDLGLDTARG